MSSQQYNDYLTEQSFEEDGPEDMWECPACKFIMSDTEYLMASHDLPCRCEKTTLSQFHLRTWESRAG